MTASTATVRSTSNAPLWGRELPLARDRARRLTPAEIAGAAFTVAEAENLQAVSVKRIAGRLAVSAPRLEGYVHDRGELLDLMVDVALGEVELPTDGAWQVRAWQIAEATREAVRRHPWLAGLLGLRVAAGPNGLRFTESALAAFAPLGLEITMTAHYVEAVLTYVCGSVRSGSVSGAVSGPGGGAGGKARPAPDLAGYLADVVEPSTFPNLARLLEATDVLADDQAFYAGLSCLLTGIAAQAAAQGARVPAAS